MTDSPDAGSGSEPRTAHDQRTVELLTALCEAPAGTSVSSCGRRWCVYWDEERATCGLLYWDVAGKLGPEALAWFAGRRAGATAAIGEHVLTGEEVEALRLVPVAGAAAEISEDF